MKSRQMAYCGIVVALSILVLFMTSLFPMADYVLPALSGILLVAIVFEFGFRPAVVAYVAVAMLAAILVPNKQVAVIFIAFLGYYPLLKGRLESLQTRVMEWVSKLICFNFALLCSWWLFTVLAIPFGDFLNLQYGMIGMWVVANAVFVVYDLALTQVITYYLSKIRPKFHR